MCPFKFLQATLTTLEKYKHSNVVMEQNLERPHKVANKGSFLSVLCFLHLKLFHILVIRKYGMHPVR